MPTQSEVERIAEEQKDRRKLLELGLTDVPQANIDLMCVVVAQDEEKRSASYWIANSFVLIYKYQDRLRKAAEARKQQEQLKENTNLFNKYIAMNPPKTPADLLTIMLRFGVCPQVSVGTVETNAQAKENAEIDAAAAEAKIA